MNIQTINTKTKTKTFPIKSAANQWHKYSWEQLELDFDSPVLRPSITAADLVLDQIYLLADEHPESPDLSAIADLCREYFFEQDGY